jgi:hypothetical protein
MFDAPFAFGFIHILNQSHGFRKSAALDILDCALHLPQRHLRDIPGGAAELHDRLEGVEAIEMPEIIAAQIIAGLDSRPGQDAPCRAGKKQFPEEYANVQLVQFFQQAASTDVDQFLEVILVVVRDDVLNNGHQVGNEV